MKQKDLIKLGVTLGLEFNSDSNWDSALAKGRVVFDGINGQRVLVESDWTDDEIFEALGKGLIEYGERKKVLEIRKALS